MTYFAIFYLTQNKFLSKLLIVAEEAIWKTSPRNKLNVYSDTQKRYNNPLLNYFWLQAASLFQQWSATLRLLDVF